MNSTSPLILAFQGSYANSQVALYRGGQLLQQLFTSGVKSSSQLIPMVEQILTAQNLTLSEIDFLAVNAGPGAFTSLRVVVVTVNALAFASGRPIMQVCGLEALWQRAKPFCQDLPSNSVVACVLNAYSEQLYVTFIVNQTRASQPLCLTVFEFIAYCQQHFLGQEVFLCGNVTHPVLQQESQFVQLQQWQQLEPTAEDVGLLALKQFLAQMPTANKILPNYIKAGFI